MTEFEITAPDISVENRARSPQRTRNLVLTIEGRFDVDAALRAVAAVQGRRDRVRVTIDVRQAPVDDVAIAVLARELAGRRVTVLGLTRHHERLIRYLGTGNGTHLGVVDG